MPNANATLPTKLLVRVLQDVVRQRSFETYADLTEAVKATCARLRIPYDGTLVSAAIDQLERGGRGQRLAGVQSPAPSRRTPAPLPTSPPVAHDLTRRLMVMANQKSFPDERRLMDSHARFALVAQLKALAERTPNRFEPPGCGYCGTDAPLVQGALCQRCADRLAQLDRRSSVPGVPSTPNFATFVSTDPKWLRRSDGKGARRESLPFDDADEDGGAA